MTRSATDPVHGSTLEGLAIFPLSTVLFPGGVLPLRIFEARYTDMVRECMRRDRPFGVCLITQGAEVGAPAHHETIGCLARIEDVDMEQPGVLRIRTLGGQRFQIAQREVAPDQLIRARALLLNDDPLIPVPTEHMACVSLLQRMVQEIERTVPDPAQRMIAAPMQFESAAWVANFKA